MIEAISIPPLATVQDLGRTGYWAQGLGRAGAMDTVAHRIANLLLGNPPEVATLEIPLTPARFEFLEPTAFAIAGANAQARLDGVELPRNWAGQAESGQSLEFDKMTDGARIYLALPGGIDVPKVLGSYSTQIREAFGGYAGRPIKAGDRLCGREPKTECMPLSGTIPPLREEGQDAIVLRVLETTETHDFSEASLDAFFGAPYIVTGQSNRQGYRLKGSVLERLSDGELRSHGIAPGTIQVPGGGQPIIQLADAATMGGYPKIGCVIEDDLWRIGQARQGDKIRFKPVTLEQTIAIAAETKCYFDMVDAASISVRTRHNSWR